MKHKKNLFHLKDMGIGKKFAVSLVWLLIIPLIIIFLWLNQNVTTYIDEQNYKTNLEVLKQTKTPINYMIQDVSFVSTEILGNMQLQNYLQNGQAWTIEQKQQMESDIRYQITKLLNSRPYISRVSIFDEEKILFQFGGYLQEEEEEFIPEVKERRGKSLWLPVEKNLNYVLPGDRVYEVSSVRGINSVYEMDNMLAYERINIEEAYLNSLYTGIADKGTSELFIVDEMGNMVSSKNKELLEKNIGGEKFFEKIKGKREGYFLNDQKEIITFYKIDAVNWYIVKIDNKEMFISGSLLNSVIAIAILLATIFGVFFYATQRKQIIIPLTLLAKEVSKFHEGEYEIQLHSTAKDEIGKLNQCFMEMGEYIQDLIERVYKSQLKEKEAQLMYLQSQINPHFLYNTLDSMRWMALKEKQTELAKQIEALSNLFRHALNQGKDMTTVGEELHHLKDYLTIQKSRFGNRLEVEMDVDPSLESYPVLNLLLQPLVENAIVHGIENKLGGGKILITVKKIESNLCYIVKDNGLGVNQEEIRKKLQGKNDSCNALALDNINKRIQYKYGEAYGILFYSQINIGTRVEVQIPVDIGGKECEATNCR